MSCSAAAFAGSAARSGPRMFSAGKISSFSRCASAWQSGSYGIVPVVLIACSIFRVTETLDPGLKNGQYRRELASIVAPPADRARGDAARQLYRGRRHHAAPAFADVDHLARPGN